MTNEVFAAVAESLPCRVEQVGNTGARQDDLRVRTAADIAPEPFDWLWQDNFALGMVAVVAGATGMGKTLLVAADFAARISTGSPWPDGAACPCGDVLICSGEDGAANTLVPRLRDHGADLKRVHILEGVGQTGRMFTLADVPALERELARQDCPRLVVIDPVSAFLGSADDTNNARMRRLLAPLQELARRRGTAFILITHLRKSAAATATHAVIGSVGLVAAARVAWIVTKDPQEEQRRVVTVAKNNLGQDRRCYAFRVIDRRVQWENGRVARTRSWETAASCAIERTPPATG